MCSKLPLPLIHAIGHLLDWRSLLSLFSSHESPPFPGPPSFPTRRSSDLQRHVLVTGAASRVGHKAAQTIEVDWSGPTMQVHDPATGRTRPVYVFVGCLPFSLYAFVEPALDMKQETWLRAHVAMFEAFGGSSPRIVPDNLKTGVLKHPREGEIVLNDAYREMAAHYRSAVLPGRIRAPKDKASV